MGQVRVATRADIPRLVDLGFEFAMVSQSIHGFNVSRGSIIEFTNEVVENPQAVVLVLVEENTIEGFIVGIKQKIYFGLDVALQEVAWYVKKGIKGLSLLFEFENQAKAVGCTRLIVGNKPAYYDLSRIYSRMGYSLLENQYVKKIGD